VEQIDWSTEWWRSPVWVGGVFLLTLVGFVLIGWLLIKRTGWGRQFWRLSSMYFIPFQRSWIAWRPILTVALLLLLTVISVRLDVLLSFQGNAMFTSLQELDQAAFWRLIGIFGILATVNVLLVLITFYIARPRSSTGGCGSTSAWWATG
jgi:putative ATP-binding cassette transporter